MKIVNILKVFFVILIVLTFGISIFNNELAQKNSDIFASTILFSIVALMVVCALPKKGMQATKLRRSQDLGKFEEIYKKLEEIEKNEIRPLRKERNRKKALCLVAVLCLYVVIISIIHMSSGKLAEPLTAFITDATILGAIYIYFKKTNTSYEIEEQRLMTAMIKEIAPELNYIHKSKNEKEALEMFKELDIFEENIKMYSLNDEITGTLDNGNTFRLFDLEVQRMVVDTGKEKTTENICSVTVACSEIDTTINGEIRIQPAWIGDPNKPKMTTDNAKFDEELTVYCNNRILAMQILTSDVMQTLLDVVDKYGMQFHILIKKNKVYTYFSEKILNTASLDKEKLYIEYGIMNYILDVIKIMNKTINNIQI